MEFLRRLLAGEQHRERTAPRPPLDPRILLADARVFLERGDLERAAARCEEASAAIGTPAWQDDSERTWRRNREQREELQRLECEIEARRHPLDLTLEQVAEWARAIFSQAERGRHDEAWENARRMQSSNPRAQGQCHRTRGYLAFLCREMEEATGHYADAVDCVPDDVDLRLELGFVLLVAREPPSEHHPIITDLRRASREREAAANHVREALAVFEGLCATAPARAEAHVGRAVCLCLERRVEEAEGACDEASRVQPDCRAARLIKASFALWRRNARDEARRLLAPFAQQEQIRRLLDGPDVDRIWLRLWTMLVTELRSPDHGLARLMSKAIEPLRIGV